MIDLLLVKMNITRSRNHDLVGGGGQGGGSPGEQGAAGVREAGEESAGSGISTMAGSGREIQKGKLLLFVTAYFQSKKRTQERFLTSIQRFPRLTAKFYTREKSKNQNSCSG